MKQNDCNINEKSIWLILGGFCMWKKSLLKISYNYLDLQDLCYKQL